MAIIGRSIGEGFRGEGAADGGELNSLVGPGDSLAMHRLFLVTDNDTRLLALRASAALSTFRRIVETLS